MLAALVATPCLSAPKAAPAGAQPATAAAAAQKTSEEYASYTYKDQAGDFTVLVDSWPAAYRTTEDYFPVVVAVGRSEKKRVKGETEAQKEAGKNADRKSVVVGVDDFMLTDAQGSLIRPASLDEIQSGYKYLLDDKNMLAEEPMNTGDLFSSSAPLSVAFYPVGGGGRFETGGVEMETFTWFMSTIYFDRPDAGLGGIMTLTLSGDGIDPPVNVRFKIPEPHEKKDKHKKH
jgi:hypothetical protein